MTPPNAQPQKKDKASVFSSTYARMTAERLLDGLGVHLSREGLSSALQNRASFFEKLLTVPYKNILNGIILDQIHEYQVYIQKLFVEYFMSELASANHQGQEGEDTRRQVADCQLHLESLNEQLPRLHESHLKLIAKTQLELMNFVKEINHVALQLFEELLKDNQMLLDKKNQFTKEIYQSIARLSMSDDNINDHFYQILAQQVNITMTETLRNQLVATFNVEGLINTLSKQIEENIHSIDKMHSQFCFMRNHLYDAIVTLQGALSMLPGKFLETSEVVADKTTLHFDRFLGETN